VGSASRNAPSVVVRGKGRQLRPTAGGSGSGGVSGHKKDVQGVWMTAVGVQDDCLGAAALYMSNDSLRCAQVCGMHARMYDWGSSRSLTSSYASSSSVPVVLTSCSQCQSMSIM
jgi:hypothetical protein